MNHIPPSRLPDFRNLGVLLRVLLLAQLLRGLHLVLAQPQWSQVVGRWLESAPLFEPALLSTTLLLYLLARALHALPYGLGVAAVLGLAALVVVAWHHLLVAGFVALPWSAWRSAGLAVAMAAALLFYFNWRQHRLSPAWAQARMVALQARIRPHFLYNSLNSVLALMRTDARGAEDMLHDLADVYRALLAEARTLVPLRDELALAQAYVRIEQRRLGGRLRMVWACEAVPDSVLVPPLLLQPLLENAVRYGVEPSTAGAEVSVRVWADAEHVYLCVRNPLPAVPHAADSEGNRMALDNIRERLALHFDAEASVRIRTDAGCFDVTVRLPR